MEQFYKLLELPLADGELSNKEKKITSIESHSVRFRCC